MGDPLLLIFFERVYSTKISASIAPEVFCRYIMEHGYLEKEARELSGVDEEDVENLLK